MKKGNTTFQDARNRKDDEFYTTYESIDSEMRHYKSHFAGKTVYCNCDDPYKSNFARYFLKNFNTLGIKRLIVTSFKDSKQSLEHNTLDKTKGRILDISNIKEGTREISDEYIDYWLHNEAPVTNLNGDGDFRSKECLALLDGSDIIVTNPPFSLMRELVSALEEHNKQYLLIGTENALTYKEIFPLIQQNKLWTGYKSGNMPFRVPEDSKERSNRYWVDDDGQKWRSLGNTIWLTNLDTPKRHNTIELTNTYNPEDYPKYDNYDAINVDRVENIPKDYPGIMGVPVTILTKLNTDQFELIGEANHGKDNDYDMFKPTINGKELFKKILIKNKSLMENEKINREVTKPEKVSFDTKEDLKAYIMDYCEKHGWDSDLNHIDVSKITDMSRLFANSNFNGNISEWNVSNVTDMSAMFTGSQFNGDIGNWDTSKVEDMAYMFAKTPFNQPLDKWNTSKVTNMELMFNHSSFNQPLDKWNVSNVTNMFEMFMESPFNQPLGNWNTGNVKDMSFMFVATPFNQILDKWNTSKVEDMTSMFAGNKALEKMPDWKLNPSVVLEDMFKGTKFEGQEESLKRSTPEKVSFDNKEDLKAYITSYCNKHGWDSDLNHIDVSRITDMSDLFKHTEFNGDISKWDTSNVQNMSKMFADTPFNQPIGNWNTSNVTNMEFMFCDDSAFNQPLNEWNISNVKSTRGMFIGTPFNQPLDKWNVSNVTNMSGMFSDSKFNQPIGNWDVSKVIDISNMFMESPFNQPINEWNVSKVTNMDSIFASSEFNQPLNNWDVSNVKDMTSMFAHTPFNQPLNDWDISNVTSTRGMFIGTPFNQSLNKWNTSNVTSMSFMFAKTPFNQPIGNWDTSNAENMKSMFSHSKFNQPINEWNVSKVTNMDSMFASSEFNQPLNNWDVSNVKHMSYMFKLSPFNHSINNWNVSNVKDMTAMFASNKALEKMPDWKLNPSVVLVDMFKGTKFEGQEKSLKKSIPEKVSFDNKEALKDYITDYCNEHGWDSDLNHIDVSRITDMSGLFRLSEFNGNISKWDTSNVQNMSEMFADTPFNQPIGNWKTSKVTNMEFMFCDSAFNQPLNDWNISNVKSTRGMFIGTPFNQPLDKWDVSNVTNMSGMFSDSKFNQPIGNWDVSKVIDISNMFSNTPFNQPLNDWNTMNVANMFNVFAESKFNQPLNKWNTSNVTSMYAMFAQTPFNQPIGNWDTSNVENMKSMFSHSKFNQPINEWNVSKVTNMDSMFASSEFNQPLDKWNTKNVKSMEMMFYNSKFNQPIDNWNLYKVDYMRSMFEDNKALEKMPDWKLNPSVVLEDMFAGTKFEGQQYTLKSDEHTKVRFSNKSDLRSYITKYCEMNGWDSDLNFIDVSKMTDMSGLFMFTKFNGDISKWDVSKVENMAYMFSRSQFNGNISEWDVSKVTNMSGMFKLSYFDQPIGNWNTGNVENMSFMFYLTPFNQPLDNWNTSKVESMAYIFYYTPFNQPLNNWDVSNVRDMTEMFIGTPFNQPLDKWNTSKVEYMEFMFSDTPFNQPLNIWDVSKVKNMSGMFANTPFNQPLDNWDTSNVTKMDEMFADSAFNQPIGNWNTSKVENMNSMFISTPFNHSLENWDVSNVTDMISMFAATPFNKDVSSWKISPQADTLDMFKKSDYSYPLPTSSDKSLTSKTDIAMEKDEKNTVQATEQSTKSPIILPPAQLLDRALETAMSGNGKWLNHKSIHSPQIYGYTGKDVQNTLSGLHQVLLALNTQENQYRTNIYATPKEIKAYNLRLDGTDAQRGITLSSPDGTAKEYFNADQLDKATIKDAYTNVQLSRADKFKPLNFAEMDDITRNKELLEKDPSSIVIFNKGSKYYLYEESALRLQDVSDIKTQKHPNTGIVYSFFHPEDIEKYIRAISNSGHKVVIANSASNFKGINIRKIENSAIRNIQKLAANEGFSIGKVTCMPSNYMPASDMVSLNVTGKERSTIHTLREIGDIYHSGFEALYSDKRLAGIQKLPMGVRESRKFSQLAMEVATGIQMLRQGLPAVISESNIPLIPNWQQQLRENPKAMALLEQHVEALTTAYERSMQGLKVDYDQLIPSDKNIQKPQEMRPEKETISRSLGEYTNYGEKKFVVIRDKSEKAAIVIFPVGASTLADTETPGFNKELIDNALRKENINQVYFMTPDTFESLSKTNDYFANTAISVEKMHYGKLSEVGKINVKDEIKRTELPEIAAMIPFTNAKKKIELYIQSTAGEEVTIPLTDKNDIKKLAKTIKQEDRGAANTTRMAIAQKYFVMAQKNPDLATDYLHPNLPQEVYDRIDKTRVICDENKDYFINANIDGKELPYKQMNTFDISIFKASSNKESFMEGIITRTFANELGLKADNKEDVDSKVSAGQQEYDPENQQQQEPEDSNENEQTEEREVRRGFHR